MAKRTVRHYFKDDYDRPFEITDGQADIYLSIVLRQWLRVEVIAPTQYGKSSVIAMALIIASTQDHENFAIVTGQENKSMIIMEKVIQHTFDHPKFIALLELDPNEPLDRIKRQRSRQYVTWKGGGSIRTFTADARNRQNVKKSLTGFGSKNVIEDEASLIPDDLQAMIMRMLGGYPDGFLLKIGNPFFRNHFMRTWQSDNYQHVFIDYHQALLEGRYTEAFIEEMRFEAFFDVLYECRFPEEDEVNEAGWRKLVTDSALAAAFEDAEVELPRPVGKPRLGVDVAMGGKNFTAFVLRYDNIMVLLEKNKDPDLMSQVGRIELYIKEYNIDAYDVTIDDNVVGHGITNRLAERNIYITAFVGSKPAVDAATFANIKAEAFWLLKQWIANGGKIIKVDDFYQINQINYKVNSSSKIIIEPKEQMATRGILSPDVADAASMTFNNAIIATAADFAVA